MNGSSRASSTKTRIETGRDARETTYEVPSRASSTKTRIETERSSHNTEDGQPSRASSTKTRIETSIYTFRLAVLPESIKSKFHENKDWNRSVVSISSTPISHQEQVPRKQGLKQDVNPKPVKTISAIKSKFHENKDWNWIWNQWSQYKTNHQEQVPRKQGLKLLHQTLIQSWKCIKSKFHENKDWNVILNYLL